MTKIKSELWCPSKSYQCFPIFIQQTDEGWFAKVEEIEGKLIAVSGPWGSEGEARFQLIDSIERIVVGTEGE